MSAPRPDAVPDTHYSLFAGLRGAGVACLAGGTLALVLHGVPRLAARVDLTVEGTPENLARLERLLASRGYLREPGAAVGTRRFSHPAAALDEIVVAAVPPERFAALRARAAAASLVDLDIPFLGADDLRRALVEEAGTDEDRQAAAGLGLLAAIRAGAAGEAEVSGDATRLEQLRKFSRWSVAARLDWLLAAARLAKGLAPEARPMTRGLVRRRPWTERRG